MKKYMMLDRRGISKCYNDSLKKNGFIQVTDPESADFLLYDLIYGNREEIVKHFEEKGKPIFVYPHSANSWNFWDGIHVQRPISCYFAFTEKIKQAMIDYGFKEKIEVCGFMTNVYDWSATDGERLLFAPMHTMGIPPNDKLLPPANFKKNRQAFERVLGINSLFKKITIRYGKSFTAAGLYNIKLYNVVYEKAVLNIQDSIQNIKVNDIIISAGTFGYLSVAMGKPTIFYNQKNEVPQEGELKVKNYNRYSWIDYPYQLNEMTDNDIKLFSKINSEKVQEWKNNNIGFSFNENLFISAIRKYINE